MTASPSNVLSCASQQLAKRENVSTIIIDIWESYDVPVSYFAYASFNHGQDRIVDWVDTIGPIRLESRQLARPTRKQNSFQRSNKKSMRRGQFQQFKSIAFLYHQNCTSCTHRSPIEAIYHPFKLVVFSSWLDTLLCLVSWDMPGVSAHSSNWWDDIHPDSFTSDYWVLIIVSWSYFFYSSSSGPSLLGIPMIAFGGFCYFLGPWANSSDNGERQ